MNQEPLSSIGAVAGESRLWRGEQAVAEALVAAWKGSRVGQVAIASAMRVREVAPARRIRFGALVVAWAGAWHLAGLVVLPRYATSGLPRAWFVAVVLVALLVALAANGLVRAWEASALRRMLSRFNFSLFTSHF